MPGERVASNLSEFLSIVAEISRRWFVKEKGWGLWFRSSYRSLCELQQPRGHLARLT
jgi:hypothetical protein